MIEIVNLVSIGIASYNFEAHVAADIGIDKRHLPSENIKSQEYIQNIEQWTEKFQIPLRTPQRPQPVFDPNRVCVHFTFCYHECTHFAWPIHAAVHW